MLNVDCDLVWFGLSGLFVAFDCLLALGAMFARLWLFNGLRVVC